MMAKLIHGMPDEPHAFLHRILQRKAEKLGEISQPRSSAAAGAGHRRSASPQSLRRSLPATSTGESLAVAKDRGYDRPWQTNTKRLPQSKGSRTDLTEVEEDGKPGWDSRTRVNFEELWGDGDTKQAARALRATRSGSPTKAMLTWADEQGEDEELLYHSYGYRGVHRSQTNSDDPLEGEFKNAKESRKQAEDTNRVVVPSKKDSRSAALRHKHELQQKLVEQTKQDSGIEDNQDLEPDTAFELMENLDDLAKEGARHLKQSGVRVSKTLRERREPEAQVRVSICARCAKVMTGGVPSEPPQDYGQLPDYDIDTEREFPDSRPQSALFSNVGDNDDDDDEEFESVSQVTGPRRPVWQEDSDVETFTPRKGEHMFSSHNVPLKGRPMYSPDLPESGQRRKKGEGHGIQAAVSTDFYTSPSSGRGVDSHSRGQGRLNQTWAPASRHDSEVSCMRGHVQWVQ
ncbi:hypothetical protein NP493_703g01006 [Ridgeia piscesae]|uniref:Uncharacterized protein n=1 Tax=Ridgeia piscesae TaxID=27915 RepID=A0AAD9KQV7_RIDPI|nr:hypothetical protein NP493_703g01006 [Ridgeia piscesae]